MSRANLPDGVTYTGPLEFSGFVEAWEQGFDSDHFELEEVLDAGDRIVAMIHHSGRGKLSQIEVDQHFVMVWTLRGGRAIRMDLYPTREEALEAAGLSE